MKNKVCIALGVLVFMLAGLNFPGRGHAAANPQPSSNELTQDEAVSLALKNNAQIKAATSREAVSQALTEYEKSRYYPKFTFRDYPGLTDRTFFAFEGALASGNPLHNNRLLTGNRVFNHLETRMELPVFDDGFFGIGSHKIAKANFTWEQSKFMTDSTKQDITSRVKNLFLAAQKAQIQKEVFQESVSHDESILQLVREKFSKNLASQKDVLLAESGLAAAQADLAVASNEYQRVLKQLFLYIGESQSKGLRLAPVSYTLKPLPPWDQVANKIPANNLDLKAKQMNINIAQEALALSKTKFYPTVDFVVRYFGSTSTVSTGFDNSYAGYFFLQIPLFEYDLYKDVGVKNQEVTLASDNYNASKDDVLREAMNQYKELQDIGPQLNSIRKKILFLEENYRESLGKYRLNLISFIELANAQLMLHEANKTLTGTYFKYEIGYRKLQNIVGEKT